MIVHCKWDQSEGTVSATVYGVTEETRLAAIDAAIKSLQDAKLTYAEVMAQRA